MQGLRLPTALLCLALLLAACQSQPSGQVHDDDTSGSSLIVASFDLGSGSARMLVAEVDACSGTILQRLDSASAPLGWAEDLIAHQENQFSAEMLAEGSATLQRLVDQAGNWQPDRMVGVATQAFRQAVNAPTWIAQTRDATGIDLRIVSRDEEAQMAWRLVQHRRGLPAESLVVWDIGAGSQQWVWRDNNGQWHFVHSDLASVTFKRRVMDVLGRPQNAPSPNPLTEDELMALEPLVPDWFGEQPELRERLASASQLVGIGGVHGLSLPRQMNLRDSSIHRSAVKQALRLQLGLDDDEIGGQYAATDVTNLVLVAALLDWLDIEAYDFLKADLTEAQLIRDSADCSPEDTDTGID